MTVVAASSAALAVLLCFPATVRLAPRPPVPLTLGVALLAVPTVLLVDGTALVAVAVLIVFGAAVLALARRSRARARADDTRRRVVEAAEAVASELRAAGAILSGDGDQHAGNLNLSPRRRSAPDEGRAPPAWRDPPGRP